jgi:hypothetical protein
MWRRATAWWRRSPDFLIVGTNKGGTTSLFAQLAEHPAVRPSVRKEPHYFSHRYLHKSKGWYLAHFPTASGAEDSLVFEASTSYLFHPAAADRARRFKADMKVLVLLRNPVDRAYSHYQHEVRKGRETLSFEESLDAEPERLRAGPTDPADGAWRRNPYWTFSYVRRGQYAEDVERWLHAFRREHVLVLESEALFSEPTEQVRHVHDFLGLAPPVGTGVKAENQSRYPPMLPETRARLERHFATYNERLYGLLRTRFRWA